MRYRNKISGSVVRVGNRTLDPARWERLGEKPKPKPQPKPKQSAMSYEDLKAEAKELGIAFKGNISRKDLTAMIKAVKSAG